MLLDRDWVCLWANGAALELMGGPGRGDRVAGEALAAAIVDAEGALRQARRRFDAGGDVVLRGVAVARRDQSVFVDITISHLPRPLAGLSARGESGSAEPSPGVGSPVEAVALATIIDATARVAAESEAARLRASAAESDRAKQRLNLLEEHITGDVGEAEMVGASSGLTHVRAQVARVAPTNTTVLVHGETGSGKELVARAVHAASARRAQAFVAVNCAALPESLIESELFGHEKGAFTGADRRRMGKFELADGGTLFLDEVAELPLSAQAKLLRVIQENAFERVGGAETVHVDVRLIAATHRDLARQVELGRFREDLYYRLNVFRIEVPPLRERKGDLRALATHLHARIARRMGRPALPISDGSLRRIMAYAWPGNVRELNNAVERATLLADGPELEIELPESPLGVGGGAGRAGGAPGSGAGGVNVTRDVLLDLTLEQLQRLQITHALESSGYRVFGPDGAAARLDINPNTLLSRMDKFGIPRPRVVKRREG
ncbi:MAG: sigma 54-interacting transcriptional regulator [Phycisphaerales bacterium]